jgi:hypothetical protein
MRAEKKAAEKAAEKPRMLRKASKKKMLARA